MVRRYKPSDFEDVDYLQKDFYLRPASREELKLKLQNPSWVFDDGGAVGCIITCPDVDINLIWSIIVASSYRGLGAGSALLQTVEEYYRDQKLWLYVEPNNPARQLYYRRGYRTAQYIKDYYGEGYDAIKMVKYCT